MSQLPRVITLMGPTCTGKTDLAIELAQRIGGEIVSVDSALVYKDMDIGTAKPSQGELNQASHHLIDIIDPADAYSAAEFNTDALALINDISGRGKVPILAGGTMLYYKSLLEGMAEMPEADAQVRSLLQERLHNDGASVLHEELSKVDPESAARIHINDPQRLLRALEVYMISGKSLTAHHQAQKEKDLPFSILKIGLIPYDRPRHRELVATRFDAMLENGFIEEVESLRKRDDLHLDLPSMRSVGYRQIWHYLDGHDDYQEMREKGITATRQLAKRQMTWLRKEQDLQEFDCFNVCKSELFDQVDVFLM